MKAIRNWRDEIVQATGHHQDHRFQPWAKAVISVIANRADGYAFVGEFVNSGTTEMEIKPQLFLVMTSSGSAKYQTRCYDVIAMDAAGSLTATGIHTDDRTAGWALRIRDQVAALLATLDAQNREPASREQLLAALREALPDLSDDEIIDSALSFYAMHAE